MKKKLFYVIIFIIIISFKLLPIEILSNNLLSTKKWVSEAEHGLNINFKMDFKCIVIKPIPPYTMFESEGYYEIKENKLFVYYNNFTNEKITLKGQYIETDISDGFKFCIRFDDGVKIFQKDSLFNEGIENKIDNIEIITMGYKNGKTLNNIKFRMQPNLNSEIISYLTIGNDLYETKYINYVPEGSSVIIIARTKNKYRIENWNNYWYYVSVGNLFGTYVIKG